jgi:hypothetical protein
MITRIARESPNLDCAFSEQQDEKERRVIYREMKRPTSLYKKHIARLWSIRENVVLRTELVLPLNSGKQPTLGLVYELLSARVAEWMLDLQQVPRCDSSPMAKMLGHRIEQAEADRSILFSLVGRFGADARLDESPFESAIDIRAQPVGHRSGIGPHCPTLSPTT